MKSVFKAAVLFLLIAAGIQSRAEALIVNPDFETGDFTGYYFMENFNIQASSTHAAVINDGFGNHFAKLTPDPNAGIYELALIQEFGPLPAGVSTYGFDFQFLDLGEGGNSGGPFVDFFWGVFNVDTGGGNFEFRLFEFNALGLGSINPGVSVNGIGNGWYHANFDISGLGGSPMAYAVFETWENADGRLSQVRVDNLGLTTVPEPSTVLLLSLSGLMAFFKRKTS